VARLLNEDIAARELAGQEDAPAFDDSEEHVREYWLSLARTAIAAMQGWRGI
jgi:hypothetical protein